MYTLPMNSSQGAYHSEYNTIYAMQSSYGMEQETGVIGVLASSLNPPSGPRESTQTLPKPVVIPRIDISGDLSPMLPFIRAYSPDLRAHDVHEADFVAFIDSLAVAQAPPIPLQVLGGAGMAVGFIPEPIAMATGTSMEVVAGVGSAAVSMVRTRSLLEKVNREYFAPRGLKVTICKDEEVARKLGFDLSLALTALDINSEGTEAGQRQLQALGPFIAPLTFDVPPPSPQRNALDKMAAKQIEREERKRKEKAARKQTKKMKTEESKKSKAKDPSGYSSDSSTDSSSSSKSRRNSKSEKQRKREEEMRKREKREAKRRKELAKKEEKEAKELCKQTKKSEKKDEKIKKMEYIVVEMLDTE